MKREDDEKLWDLLGRSAEPTVSPFFVRNVLRKIRAARGESSVPRWLTFRWLVPASAVAVVAVVAALSLRVQMPAQRQSNSPADKLASMEAKDSVFIADLDDLVCDDNTSLDDSVLL